MQSTIFREYDIRGIVGAELYEDKVYDLGRALAYYFITYGDSVKTVIIGRDNRIHSELIEQELSRAFIDSGLNVIYLGICPTPVVYFSLQILSAEASVMVTASHNSKDYNGLKISVKREPVYGAQIKLISDIFYSGKRLKSFSKGIYKNHNMADRYTDWLVNKFEHLKNFDKTCVIDCSSGATCAVIPNLINKLNFKNFEIINSEFDGNFSQHEPDPIDEKNITQLRQAILLKSADLGIGFDGDGDRMAALTKDGNLVSGDKLIAVYTKDIAIKSPGSKIIYDFKCSLILDELINKWSCNSKRVPSGHAVVKNEMKKEDAIFGGELSGHFYFKDNYFGYDDGIYAFLRLIDILNNTGQSLDNILKLMPSLYNTPELRIPCDKKTCTELIENTYKFFAAKPEASLSKLDGLQAVLPYGWGLIRCSNTESVMSLRFESKTIEGLEKVKKEFFSILVKHIDSKTLEKALNINKI